MANAERVEELLLETKKLSELIKSLEIYTQDFQVESDPQQRIAKLDRRGFALIVDHAQAVAKRTLGPATWLAMAARISDEIVEDLRKKVKEKAEKIQDRYNERDIPLSEVARENNRDRRELCLLLNEVKKNNGGKLPKDLEDDWDDQLCSTYKFA